MAKVLADHVVGLSELKKNPMAVMRLSPRSPVAVLNHNKPAFYMLTPEVFEGIVDRLADRHVEELALSRLPRIGDAVEVSLDELEG